MQSPDPFDPDPLARDDGRASNPYDVPKPYEAPAAEDLTSDSETSLGPPTLRTWTTILVPAVSLLAFLFFSGLMLLVAMAVIHGHVDRELLSNPKSYRAVSESRIGLFLVVVIPQLAMLVPAIMAARLSPVPTLQRLGLVRGQWPIWAWIAAAAATPLVGLVSSIAIGAFMEESENLKMMSDIFREHGESGFLIPLTLMISVTPAICEELLFRGYVQTRLTRASGPTWGILIASFLFAVFHMDLVHIVAVFPLGLFLGFVTWRSGSLFPAMIGHFVNNAISVIAVVIAPQGETDTLDVPVAMVSLSIMGTGIIGLSAVIAATVIYGRPRDDVA